MTTTTLGDTQTAVRVAPHWIDGGWRDSANVLYLFALMVRDILWFRLLAVVAAACLIPYLLFRPSH